MIPGLAAKRWDMINTGIFWTEERSKLMYTIPYEQAAISFLAAKGNPQGLKTVDDLAGKRIAVELGGIEERRTREVAKMATDKGLKPINVMTFNNFAEAFQALRAGQADAATSIDATAMFMQNRGDFTRAISGVFPQTACFALANKTAADAIVGALNELKKDGTYDKLLDQYGVLKIDEASFSIKGPGAGLFLSFVVLSAANDSPEPGRLRSYFTNLYLLEGALWTIGLTISTLILGGLLGLLLAVMRLSKHKALSRSAQAYVWIFRGTPLLVQLIIIYTGLPQLGLVRFSVLESAILGLGAERGGLSLRNPARRHPVGGRRARPRQRGRWG